MRIIESKFSHQQLLAYNAYLRAVLKYVTTQRMMRSKQSCAKHEYGGEFIQDGFTKMLRIRVFITPAIRRSLKGTRFSICTRLPAFVSGISILCNLTLEARFQEPDLM